MTGNSITRVSLVDHKDSIGMREASHQRGLDSYGNWFASLAEP